MLWRHLSRRQLGGWKFSRQMPVGPFICDFLCRELRLIVEVDGGQHNGCAADLARTRYLQMQGFRVVRYWNNDISENLEGLLEHLRMIVEHAHSQPPPASGRGH
ncbi:MAG TPA: endonuclease domain-containing protein [Sphingomicrobium sp.]|nr:endonuclease domain-containing protein [Sphingomicrobium sp.]